MKKYEFTLTGITPLLMHADDVAKADELGEWRKAPENKDRSKAGDDRTPPWTWMSYVYGDGNHICIPSDNIMTALRDAGAAVRIKGNKTYKSLTQSGMFVDQFYMPLIVGGKKIPLKDIESIDGEFHEHEEACRELGFWLFVKRAVVGQSKHVRVRPRFDDWQVSGTLIVTETEDLKLPIIQQIFDIAGRTKGIGDWRPSSPRKPGQFGKFSVELNEIK